MLVRSTPGDRAKDFIGALTERAVGGRGRTHSTGGPAILFRTRPKSAPPPPLGVPGVRGDGLRLMAGSYAFR